jgi:MoaA/NifB/PqqE/SkfB family radical SAM enzyme
MYKSTDIKAVHLEMTEKCNLACLMCDRNKNGEEVNQYLDGRSLSFEDIHRSFPPSFIKQLKKVYMCGNYGDPILAPDTLQIMRYFRSHNEDMFLEIITNGCSRPSMWWRELAKVVDVVRFSIDGLEDTHKIYRKNAIWYLIVRNARAFIDAGGTAIWDYLVFGHNEHQIEEARSLAKEWGFKEFVVKKTGRFFSNVKLTGKDEHVGLTKPKQSENINKSLKKEQEIVKKYGSMDNYLDQVEIECKVLKNNEIYISAEGLVFPCCWLAGQMYKWYLPPKSTQIWELVDKGKINIKTTYLQNIIDSDYFNSIKERWFYNSIDEGKLKTCALKCGKELDQFGDQYK